MSYQQKFYIKSLIIMAVLGGFMYLGYFLFTLIVDTGDAVKQSQTDLAVLFAKKGQITDLVKEYDLIKDAIPKLDSALLRSDDALGFIMHVEDMALQTGVIHKIAAVDTAQDASKIGAAASFLFNLELTGSFSNILKFVYLIENTMPYASLQTLQLSAKESASEQSPGASEAVNAHASIKVYAR